MAVNCIIYGLGLQFNVLLDALTGLPQSEKIDVYVDIADSSGPVIANAGMTAAEFYVSVHCDAQGVPEFRASHLYPGGIIRVAYSDGFIFDLDAQGQEISAYVPPGQLFDDLVPALLGPVMGILLRIRGITCLHASAVAVDGRAIGLVGASGAGKSTTAAAFARLGYSVLTDDVLALTDCDDHFLVRPAYPRIRLWPQSVAGLFGSADALPRMMPGWDKRFLSLQQPSYRFQSESLPLAALYFLEPRGEGDHVSAIEAVNPAEALMTLVSDSFATNFQDKPRRAAEFDLLSRLVATIPLRRISAPDDLARIDELCSAIAQDVRVQCATAEAL